MKHQEEKEQEALFQWAGYIPGLRWMHAIPNGGRRDAREAARLKRQGVKAGVSDIFLPMPKGCYHGLYIEMKRSSGPIGISQNQKEFIDAMNANGYRAEVCRGFHEAKELIQEYMQC